MSARQPRRGPKQIPFVGWALLSAVALASGTLHEAAYGATLQTLLSGGTIVVGNSMFHDWQLLTSDATNGVPPIPSLISVDPLADDPLHPGLQFTTTSQLAVSGINAIDVIVQFRVDALAGSSSFTGHSLTLTGIAFGTHGGIAYVSDELTSYLGADSGAAVAIVDKMSDVSQLNNTSTFSPRAGLIVAANVFITGLASGDSINLTSFNQRFTQNGPMPVAGDYNENGTVDAADYAVWRRLTGTGLPLPNNPLGGTIGPDQYNLWRANFGKSSSGAAAGAFTQVPEPSGVILILGSFAFYSCRLHRNRKAA